MPLPGPDTRVTELRVPGLGGTTGSSLLDTSDTVSVGGDTVGRLVRPADRLHRPTPGPMLRALSGSVPRTLEGYLWGRMTTGSAAQTAWVLLFPFTLANVAAWMLPPVDPTSTAARVFGSCCRALLRLAALLLTMLLVTQLAVITLELLAAQCLAPETACLQVAPSWLNATSSREIIGLLPIAAIILLLHRVGGTRWRPRDDAGPESTGPSEATEPVPGAILRERPGTGALRHVHTTGTLAALTVLMCGGPLTVPQDNGIRVMWLSGLVLFGLAAATAMTRPPRVAGEAAGWTAVAIAAAAAVTAAVIGAPLGSNASSHGMSGTNSTVEALAGSLVLVCALFALVLVPAALLARTYWRDQPKRLRPWAGGWAAAPTLVLACLLGGGFGAGSAVAVRQLVGDTGLRLPESYTLITMLWGAALAVAILLALAGFAVAVPIRRLRRGIPTIVRLLHPRDRSDTTQRSEDEQQSDTSASTPRFPEDAQETAAAAWARAGWERHWLHRLVLAFVLVMSAGAIALLVGAYGFHTVPTWLLPLSGVGVATLGLFAIGLLRVIVSAARGIGGRRHLGAFADLVSFWPRAAHPAVPPCYALKVVPEVAARAREELADPGTRVVLAGYQIGGLLAAIAAGNLATSLPEHQRERLGLVTAGSPLQWGYQRAFPAVFPLDSLAGLYTTLHGRWRGLCRGTDAFGGGATSWRHQVAENNLLGVGFLPDGGIGALPAGELGPNGALVIGGDHWLPDPMHGPRTGHRWAAGVQRGNDYIADPEWDRAVSMAAGLALSSTIPTSILPRG